MTYCSALKAGQSGGIKSKSDADTCETFLINALPPSYDINIASRLHALSSNTLHFLRRKKILTIIIMVKNYRNRFQRSSTLAECNAVRTRGVRKSAAFMFFVTNGL